jgi:hypothetical protein
VFQLFKGAVGSGFAASELVEIFDAVAFDSSFGRQRKDADGAARELDALTTGIYRATGEKITYLAGLSFGGVTINEYLYGVTKGIFSAAQLDLKGVYYVGAPNVHKINLMAGILASGGDCIRSCELRVISHLGGPGSLDIRKHFGQDVIVVARSAPITAKVDLKIFEVNIATTDGLEITGGASPKGDDQGCHCVSRDSSWWDARELFRLND